MNPKRYPWDQYPIEVQAFRCMHDRVRNGKSPSVRWPRTLDGFYAFLKYVGIAPCKMKRPTIGRKDHKRGYVPGNCGWQEHRDNCAEAGSRSWSRMNGHSEETKRKLSKHFKGRKFSRATLRKISIAQKARFAKPEERLKHSQVHLGHKASAVTKRRMAIAQRQRRAAERISS